MNTAWEIKTNILYEMCCFLNTLCIGRPYRDYYRDDYEYWMNLLGNDRITQHLNLIRRTIYQERNQIISSELCLYFSMLSGNPTVEEVLNITEGQLKIMRKRAEQTYWDEKNWDAFIKVLPSVQAVLNELTENGFPEYWDKRYKHELQAKCSKIREDIGQIDIVSEIERICRKKIPDNKVELFVVYFTVPHCIKLYNNGLIGMSVLSPVTMAWIALHEMIHTPYKYGEDIRNIIDCLKRDKRIKNAVENHEKWIGYNTYEAWFDEQCTKALDQFIGENLGIIPNDAVNGSVQDRKNQDDGGIHVLFPVIYNLLKEEYDYSESFQEFIVRMHEKGKLAM